jgi:four helix bundle protein
MGKSNGLKALELAQLMVKEVRDAIDDFPKREPLNLRAQLGGAVNSVAANIAEGYGRGATAERHNRLRIARGCLEETQSHLNVAPDSEYISKKTFYRIWNRTVTLDRMIAKLMRRM